MKKYIDNSPQAMARVLIMQMMAEADTTPEELDQLEHLDVYKLIGLERKAFIQVLNEYCNDLSDDADAEGRIALLGKERVDDILGCITERKKQLLLAALSLGIFKTNKAFSEIEMLLFRHILKRWHLTLEEVQNALQ